MRRAAWAIPVAVVWLAVGLFGVSSYGHRYYTYRGFAPPSDPPGVARGTLVRVHFFSHALGSRRNMLVDLPPGYSAASKAGKRFPVLYLLHGSPGNPALFVNAGHLAVEMDTLVARRRMRPYIVAMPSGGNGSFQSDTEWANTSHGRFESFVLDAVHAVDRRFATLHSRRYRAIGGDSEGGYAAMNIGLRHLALFGTIESWSGYFVAPHSGVFAHGNGGLRWANSPASYVPLMHRQLRDFPLHVFIYTGAQDKAKELRSAFVRELRRAHVPVLYRIPPGHHSWKLWRGQMPAALRFAGRWFGSPAGPGDHLAFPRGPGLATVAPPHRARRRARLGPAPVPLGGARPHNVTRPRRATSRRHRRPPRRVRSPAIPPAGGSPTSTAGAA